LCCRSTGQHDIHRTTLPSVIGSTRWTLGRAPRNGVPAVGGAERHDRMLSKHRQTCTYNAAKIVTLRISLLPAFQPTLLALQNMKIHGLPRCARQMEPERESKRIPLRGTASAHRERSLRMVREGILAFSFIMVLFLFRSPMPQHG